MNFELRFVIAIHWINKKKKEAQQQLSIIFVYKRRKLILEFIFHRLNYICHTITLDNGNFIHIGHKMIIIIPAK